MENNQIFWRLTKEEKKDIEELMEFFEIKARTKLLKKLVKIAKKKYIN